MAFDYGTKRIGLAVSDSLQIIATALDTVHPKDIWTFLTDYLQQETVSTFVVGYPRQLDGSDSVNAQHVTGFVRQLKKAYPAIPVVLADERFTSKIALQTIAGSGMKKSKRQDKKIVDQVAAVLILQSYMENKSLR